MTKKAKTLLLSFALGALLCSCSGQLIPIQQAENACVKLSYAGIQALADLVGTSCTYTYNWKLEGFAGSGACTQGECSKLKTFSTLSTNLQSYVHGLLTYSSPNVMSWFGSPSPEYLPPSGGAGSGGGFQFHCNGVEVGGCGGGGGGGYNLQSNNTITPEVGGGGGCSFPQASFNYGCQNGYGDAITDLQQCVNQASSYGTFWNAALNFQQQLKYCASRGELTIMGGGGGGGGMANNEAWVGYGCSFEISVNGAPYISSPSSSYVQGPLMTQAYEIPVYCCLPCSSLHFFFSSAYFYML